MAHGRLPASRGDSAAGQSQSGRLSPTRDGLASSYDWNRAQRPNTPTWSAGPKHEPVSAPAGPPLYKGEPLDGERGPGLGCFWIQVGLLTFFLIFTPLTVMWSWDPFISGALLIFTLILLLFTGQTVIFLLRLVAADRRTQRHPLDPNARKTVGQLEEDAAAATANQPSPAVTVPDATLAPDTDEATPRADQAEA